MLTWAIALLLLVAVPFVNGEGLYRCSCLLDRITVQVQPLHEKAQRPTGSPPTPALVLPPRAQDQRGTCSPHLSVGLGAAT